MPLKPGLHLPSWLGSTLGDGLAQDLLLLEVLLKPVGRVVQQQDTLRKVQMQNMSGLRLGANLIVGLQPARAPIGRLR
jgi:hypothetical protein